MSELEPALLLLFEQHGTTHYIRCHLHHYRVLLVRRRLTYRCTHFALLVRVHLIRGHLRRLHCLLHFNCLIH
jgi:hypothetical protein